MYNKKISHFKSYKIIFKWTLISKHNSTIAAYTWRQHPTRIAPRPLASNFPLFREYKFGKNHVRRDKDPSGKILEFSAVDCRLARRKSDLLEARFSKLLASRRSSMIPPRCEEA